MVAPGLVVSMSRHLGTLYSVIVNGGLLTGILRYVVASARRARNSFRKRSPIKCRGSWAMGPTLTSGHCT